LRAQRLKAYLLGRKKKRAQKKSMPRSSNPWTI
jgi:hypothetical protein